MDSCLYHKDKWSFEQVQKYLQSSGWISRQYVHRLAMAICSCRNFKGEVASIADLQVQRDFLTDLLNSDQADSKQKSHSILLQWITDSLDIPENYSHARLVTTLYNARHNDFRLLMRENVSSNKQDTLPQKKKTGTQKLTATQIECIKRKRKRKYISKLVKLDMFPGNTQKLELNLGGDFLKTNRGYLDYQRDLNDKSFENNRSVTYVKVWSRDISSLNSMTSVLISSSRDLQRKLDNLRTMRRSMRVCKPVWNTNSLSNQAVGGVGKDQLAADFELKNWKQIKAKSQTKKPACSVLQGGHCLQCFQTFASLKDNSLCTYHPGYLNNKGLWSCCLETSGLDSHTETGCMTSAQHKWRRHAKRSRSNEKKVTYTDKQFARTRHVKHRHVKHERHRR